MNYVASLDDALLCSDQGKNLAPPLKVSQLVSLLKRDVEEKHRNVCVVGEVSSFKQWRSGHCYFDIKDEEALLPAVMFKPHFARLQFAVSDGMQMMFTGRVSIYNANARLQMIVESMEPLGQGALALAFEQLKERLKQEGLFDARHKKPVKAFNQCIGLITSSHGAVLRDMVRILKTRMPGVNILFVPVRVQGAGAASEIANAVSFLDGMGECDVIIVGRGGGSLEDLWAFNEEVVARAIFRAKTPIISAVGHETDTTMSDFVADVRAATPTHAAVMVVPKREDILAHLATMTSSLKLRHDAVLRRARLQLLQEKRRLLDPRVVLFRHWQVLDETQKRLETRLTKLMRDNAAKLDELKRALYLQSPLRQMRFKREAFLVEKERLRALSPERTLALMHARTLEHKQALVHFMRAFAKQRRNEHGALVTKLDALSPLRVLSRGYSVVDDDEGRVLSKASHFAECQRIRIRVEDGVVKAQVQEIVRGT